MTTPFRIRTAVATFTGLAAVAALAGCASAADGATSNAAGSASSGAAATDSSATYKDGTYAENGSYNSPGGHETINVSLTLKANVVTAVTVKTVTADATAASYEKLFIGGISKEVVGKKLNTLSVSRVGGSSLTSQGFNSALTAIKADAKS
jgi:hypothetical protein